jgi:hypothetical protein
MKITPDLIPHTDFHTGSWLQSTARPSWYYFRKKYNCNKITNEDFIKSVDEPLKDLVIFLHENGIRTTPSCSGHHKSERDFDRIYRELEEDMRLIRNGGLNLKDVETGRLYLFQDKNYELPWKKQDFLERIMAYQHKGILGLRISKRKKIGQALLNLKIANVKVVSKKSILFFLTCETDYAAIKKTWEEITRQVKSVFNFYKSEEFAFDRAPSLAGNF